MNAVFQEAKRHPASLRCFFEGTHRPQEGATRFPVRLPMSHRSAEPQSAPCICYYTIVSCRACGVEYKKAHGFEWSSLNGAAK